MNWAWVSPSLIVTGAIIIVALERRFPYNPAQRLFRKGFFTDLIAYGLVQSYLLGLVITALIVAIDDSTGCSRLQLVSDWPVAAQLVFFLVTHDLYIYGFHRLQHRSALLWRTHEAHHSVEHVDWMAGTRSHPLEILINQTVEFLPIALLGAAPEVALMKATIDAVWGMYIHSNINVRSGWLQYVVNGPEMHRWHHARNLRDRNFSTKLAVWDFLWGTAYLPANRKADSYGLDGPFPQDYMRQVLWAFRSQHKPDGAQPSAPTAAP